MESEIHNYKDDELHSELAYFEDHDQAPSRMDNFEVGSHFLDGELDYDDYKNESILEYDSPEELNDEPNLGLSSTVDKKKPIARVSRKVNIKKKGINWQDASRDSKLGTGHNHTHYLKKQYKDAMQQKYKNILNNSKTFKTRALKIKTTLTS
mmetsp:Transcript_38677/g.37027  ORF Transcript_38677/g.37027 Transcript_38677/m.37027 type:complete len:152 (-) Transcript_38677:334-789(-)|eukprot:CAMPEP_0170547852 /NCGR_PEP_ID=MMETSP0211-20121228/6162_1 /TAXON_ID=311385 /ORGANISM="Pseudokeronopsis sp., Strain OXSARD2" /LENGTH=151 /DNA_ID=CAMNT_0010853053 /DNA_START=1044 /DNA_END=1499 /DNA_ORIENTATION=+